MVLDADEFVLISENQTRKQLIDPLLARMGWLKKYIKEEVNSIKSDFNDKHFVPFKVNIIESGIDRFIDYVLLDDDFTVLAIIESKRYSLDEEKGRIQARTYSKDIENQVNRKIPIFLTNGVIWRFIDEDGNERKVSGPFTREDLKRRSDLKNQRRDPGNVNIDSRIIDRPRNFQVVRVLSEHFSYGHRKALVQMATGTGKTRVAMAIIKLLINANMIRNVLFIADRIPLVNQAETNGFKQFFTEPVADLRKGFTTSARLYVSRKGNYRFRRPRCCGSMMVSAYIRHGRSAPGIEKVGFYCARCKQFEIERPMQPAFTEFVNKFPILKHVATALKPYMNTVRGLYFHGSGVSKRC